MLLEKQEFIKSVWKELHQEDLDVGRLASTVIADCGYDGHRLSSTDLVDVFHGSYRKPWHLISFALGEVLSFYSAGPITKNEAAGALFAAVFYTEATDRGEGDLSLNFPDVLCIACAVRAFIPSDLMVYFFIVLLRNEVAEWGD